MSISATQKPQIQVETREFLPWSSRDPSAMTCREVYQEIYRQRSFGIKIQGPQDYFSGLEQLPSIALRPTDLKPAWEIKSHSSRPIYSFVIPTYNQPEFLTAVLKQLSKLKEPGGSWEVIVVDDGSPGDNLEKVKSYLCDEDLGYNLKYFYWTKPQPIFRAGEARNLGAEKAEGEVLIFLDSDILVPNHFLSEVKSSLSRATLVQFVREHIKPQGSHVHTEYESVVGVDCYIEEEHYWRPFFESENWEEISFFWKYTCSYALAILKSEFELVRGFNPCFTTYGFEDTDFGYRLYKKSKRFELNKTKLLHLTGLATQNKWLIHLRRQECLTKTAKIFFLSHLDPEIYEHFRFYMNDSGVWRARLINFFRQKFNSQSQPKKLPSQSQQSGPGKIETRQQGL
jgi:glycosyltransferase involved in cell wall biosynthesis